jgi:hypothetical protein
MNTQNLGSNAGTFFEMGQRAGGRGAGVGSALKVLVDSLQQDKAIKQELDSKKELISYEKEQDAKYRDPTDALKTSLGLENVRGIIDERNKTIDKQTTEDWAYGVSDTPPKSVLGQLENIKSDAAKNAPIIASNNITEGGSVGTMPGSYKKDGVIYDAAGKEIGGYLQGANEPQQSPELRAELETSGIEDLRKSLKAKIQSKKFGGDQDYKDSLRDWSSGAVDDDTAFNAMLSAFPEKAKEIGEFYFLRTGKLSPNIGK